MRVFLFMLTFVLFTFMFSCSDEETLTGSNDQVTTYSQTDLQVFNSLDMRAGNDRSVRVMTRNIYVGADVDVVLSATSPEDIPVLAAQAFQELLSTNFPERAVSLVREIALTKPDLIALQEVALVRLQDPGDAIVGGTTPAEDVFMDYMDILMQTMEAMGLSYKIAAVVTNADVEIPMVTGTDPLTFADIRLTDHDVILVHEDVEFSDVLVRNYQYNLVIPDLGLEVLRGFTAVDAVVGNTAYRFVNTHLEPFAQPVKVAQTEELLATLEDEELPVIMLGDFNSEAPAGEVYNMILSQGYQDIWLENTLEDDAEGNTYGHDSGLRNETADFYERIDHIYFRHGDEATPLRVHAIVVGDEQFNRTSSGLWPSDHGGVAARIRMAPAFKQKVMANLR
jgi:endonuclease/exonuclease/phosphatase family metal-dependent hydrolase